MGRLSPERRAHKSFSLPSVWSLGQSEFRGIIAAGADRVKDAGRRD
jgi:hypothetical protein